MAKEDRDLYAQLADLMKNIDERNKVKAININDVSSKIVNLNSLEIVSGNLDAVYHMLRYLRNICIQCRANQDLIVEGGIVGHLKSLIEFIFDPTLVMLHKDIEFINKVKLMSVQFLGNLVVQNENAIKNVWQNCFPHLFFTMMSNFDGKGKDFVCMVVYNCFRNSMNLTEKKEEVWLLNSIISHCSSYEEAEWGLLVLELVISTDNFILLYKELLDYPQLRSSLLDILVGYLSDSCSNNIMIPESNLILLSNEFETKASCMVLLTDSSNDDVLEECQLLFKILNVLSTATGFIERYENLRGNEKLITSTVSLLKQICACTEPVTSATNGVDDKHPLFDFKRNLVKMIGNMCYMNRSIQDKIRELDGITAVMNCCSIDERNPYLMQWAIFAVRALCDGNMENQQFISGLENQGIVRNLMSDSVNATLENGKIKVSSRVRGS